MFSMTEKERVENMGVVSPITYHCKRCHHDKTTKNRTGRGHKLPTACGHQGCGSPYFDSFPEVCYKENFEPFASLTPKQRAPFFNYDTNEWCEKCFFDWAKEMRVSERQANELWEKRPTSISAVAS